MKTHDRWRIVFAKACQNWRAFTYVMQVHENHPIKRAGVAGIRARAIHNHRRHWLLRVILKASVV
ncbi:hypothetical protein CI266_002954 [Salmonella enterica subsp. enterica serovar Kotte]|nr:hypothetical protein [Salmonella enterica subsp. enterica serovar Kotte]